MRMNGISNHTEYHEDSFTAANLLMLKEKIISTDELIRSYNTEREANEKHVSEVKRLIETAEQLHKDCMKYETQLSENLQELQPCKDFIKELQEQNSKHIQQISDLENKLAAGEKLRQQYEALLKNKEEQKDQNYVEKDEMDKQIGKKEKEIKRINERLTKISNKLDDRTARSQKLVKAYNTSVKHLLKFGKKLIKQKNVSKVDQKIIDYYTNMISKQKNSHDRDDNEFEISHLYEETDESHTELSDNSFEVIEETIISSPYKSTPVKTMSNAVFCSPSKRKYSDSRFSTSKNLDEVSLNEPQVCTELPQSNNNLVQKVTSYKRVDDEITENFETPDCMPVIGENDTYPENAYSSSENLFNSCRNEQSKIKSVESSKADNKNTSDCSNEQTKINVIGHSKINNELVDMVRQVQQNESYTHEIRKPKSKFVRENEVDYLKTSEIGNVDITEWINDDAKHKKINTLRPTYSDSRDNGQKVIACEESLDIEMMQPIETYNNQGSNSSEIENSASCDEISNVVIDIDNSHKELEEEIARITYDMCSQGAHFHPLSPLPPTPPPSQGNSRNLKSTNETNSITDHNIDYASDKISNHCNINSSMRKKHKQKLDFDINTNSHENKATEHTNGPQKLLHQQSQGFDVSFDDDTYSRVEIGESNQYSQTGQQQNQCSEANVTGSHLSNASPPISENPELPLQQSFQANILHCPVDGNLKINIHVPKRPNERKDHKITSLNVEVNNITREFNISCSSIPCEYKNSSAEIASCPCCENNLGDQISNVQKVEPSNFVQSNLVQMDSNVITRLQPLREKIKPITPSSSKPVCHIQASKQKNYSEKHNDRNNTNDFYGMPSSEMTTESFQASTTNIFDGSCKFSDVIKNSSIEKMTNHKSPVTKALAVSPSKQKVHNVSHIEQPETSQSKPLLGAESAKPILSKESCSTIPIQSTSIKQTKSSSPNKQNGNCIQTMSCIKQAKSLLSKQKDISYTGQVFLSKKKIDENSKLGTSIEKSKFLSQVAKKDVDIFPILRKVNSSKRLSDDNEGNSADYKIEASSEQTLHLSKKCKLNTKTNETTIEYDFIADHFWKLGRNIYDVKSSVPKTMEEIQKLKQSSVKAIQMRNLELKLANPHHILSTDTFVQSILVFLANTQKNPFITYSVSCSPLLTDFENNLIAVLQFIEAKGYNHLRNLTTGLKVSLLACIFNKGKRSTLFGTASLCRTYVALCRQHGELEEARIHCYDLFCKLPDYALFLVTSALSVWPDILVTQQSIGTENSKRDVLQNVYMYLLLNGSHTLNKTLFAQCMTVLKILCNISSPFNDIITLGKYVINTFEDICTEKIHDNCSEIKFKFSEASMAIELLAIQAGLISQLKEFFDELLMPTFITWREKLVQKTKKYETLLTFWMKIICAIGHHCFQIENYYFKNIMKLLYELLMSLEASVIIQESAFISLLTLQPLCNDSYLQNIYDWLVKHEQNLSGDGKAFIEKINLKLVLTTLDKERTVDMIRHE